MASVWVIEEGEYSDYHIVGVFSSYENALEVLEKLPQDHFYESANAEIVEWPLDPFLDALHSGLKPFYVHMLQNGDVDEVKEEKIDSDIEDPIACPLREFINGSGEIKTWPASIYGTILAKDEKHAIKIVNEYRIRILAEGWPPDQIDKEVVLKRSNPTTYKR